MNLETQLARQHLSIKLKNAIDTWCSDHFDDGPRGHLGASQIGNSCSRSLWYAFRWIAHTKHDGRMQRLFQRGHFEEPRFCSYLEAIGFKVVLFAKTLHYHPESECYFYKAPEEPTDPCVVEVEGIPYHEERAKESGVFLDKGKRQIRISDCNGHFGGSIDGIAEHPEYGRFLTEFKTQGTGKKFLELCERGVKEMKPVHFRQMSVYGHKLGLKYAIYMAVNKNDDSLHVEVVKLDNNLGEDLIRKADMIITAQEPPAKIAKTPAYYECSFCDFKQICHHKAEPLKNCRSCKKCFPKEDASWYCIEYEQTIPNDFLKKGCEKWESLV